MAIKGNESIPVNILWAMTKRGIFFKYNMAILAIPRQKAMGTPIARQAIKTKTPMVIYFLLNFFSNNYLLYYADYLFDSG